MRECRNDDCDFVGNEDEFPLANTIKGKKYYRHLCNECYVIQKKVRRIERRNEFAEFKKTLECNRCGFDDWRALQFHHKEPDEKEHIISSMVCSSYSMERIMEEVDKCEVLCANCHQIEHYIESVV